MRPGASVRPLLRRKARGGAGTPPAEHAAAKLKKLERNRISVVMIRLARVGAPKQPYYRIVVIEKDRARNGRSIEVVGTYNPRTNPATVDLKHERIAYWRGKGAKLSPILEKLVAKNPAKVAEPVQDPVRNRPRSQSGLISSETPPVRLADGLDGQSRRINHCS